MIDQWAMKGIIVGFGNMGRLHYKLFQERNIEISAIVEVASDKVDVDAEVYKSLTEIPSYEGIDFICIATPTDTHFNILMEALKADLPIFLEKPAVRTIKQVQAVRKLQKDKIFVGEVELFNPNFRGFVAYSKKPKSIIISREVNLHYFTQDAKPWFLQEALSGGIVLDLMVHDITLLIEKYGMPVVRSVSALKKVFDVNDFVEVCLAFDGFEALVRGSWIGTDENNPINVLIDVESADENITFGSDSYLTDRSMYKLQIKAFLEGIEKGFFSYPCDLFLSAVEVCLEINSNI